MITCKVCGEPCMSGVVQHSQCAPGIPQDLLGMMVAVTNQIWLAYWLKEAAQIINETEGILEEQEQCPHAYLVGQPDEPCQCRKCKLLIRIQAHKQKGKAMQGEEGREDGST